MTSSNQPAAASSASRNVRTVLLVDDEEMLRSAVKEFLTMLEYTVIEAASGESALQAARSYEGEIDVVITDMAMPGEISGLELVAQLRAEGLVKRAVIMSGYGERTDAVDQARAQGVVFLQKPFQLRDLPKVLRSLA